MNRNRLRKTVAVEAGLTHPQRARNGDGGRAGRLFSACLYKGFESSDENRIKLFYYGRLYEL
jgi:hypothetical protein